MDHMRELGDADKEIVACYDPTVAAEMCRAFFNRLFQNQSAFGKNLIQHRLMFRSIRESDKIDGSYIDCISMEGAIAYD
jgi:hypothetical protein